MKLFVAIVTWDYEGADVIGVFDTKDLAQAACDLHKYKDGNWRGDTREVVEYELNEDTWKADAQRQANWRAVRPVQLSDGL